MYVINKTDGNIAATVNDGVIDTSQTDITLVGKNYLAYGEVINENFIKMLENFANTTPPTRPLTGELWYDTTKKKLFVYNDLDGSYKTLNVVTVQVSAPTTNITGDLWYDTANAQLKFWNGSAWQVITPIYTASQGVSGPVVETITSNVSTSHVVTKFYNGGNIIAVLTEAAFTPSSPIPNFGLSLEEGLNLANTAIVNGTVTNSQRLANLLPASFMRTDQNTSTTGTITVSNNGGIILGSSADLDIKIGGSGTVVASKINGNDIDFYVRNSVGSNVNVLNMASDGNVTFIRDVNANNFIASDSVIASGNLDVTLDSNIGGTLTVGVAVATPTIIVNDLNTANITATNIDATVSNINTLNANLVCINTSNTDEIVNIAGSIQFEGQDYIAFVDNLGNEAYVQGNNGELLIGTQSLDSMVIYGDQTVDFIEGFYSPNAEIDNFLSGNIVISGNVITTTNVNGNINIFGDGTGGVLTGNLTSSSTISSPILLATATNQATGLGTGALRVNGGVSINRNTYIGGNLTVADNIVTTEDLTVTGLINGQLAPGAQPGITAVGALSGLTVTGAIFATGDITAFFSSDARFKENVQNIPDALAKIKSINGVTYDWNELAKKELPHANEDRQIGVIAQEIEAVQPELVKTRESGYLAVDYEKLTAVLIEAVKELSAKVETLEAKLDSLQS